MDMSTDGGLQFLPSQHRSLSIISLPGSSGLLRFSFVVIFVLAGYYGALLYFTNSAEQRIVAIDNELRAIQKERDRAMEGKLLNVSQQLSTVRTLLNSHVVWSDVFMQIQRTIEPSVTFTSLDADTAQKRYLFHATADSYAIVAKQLASLYHVPIIKDLSLSRVQALNSGGVEFTVDIKL